MSMKPGQIVRIHSLQSAAGMELNGERAAVLQQIDGRYEVKVEFACDTFNQTKLLKAENLSIEDRLSLPTGYGNRGFCMSPGPGMNRTLCELLLWHRDDYEPPETMLTGYASMAFSRMGQSNFEQMEQMAAVLSLANTCLQAGEPATCDVLFALLEGDNMYLEVLAQTLYHTGFIGPENKVKDEWDFYNCPSDELTPDQDQSAYIRTMEEGPLLLLREMTKYKLGLALFAALKECQFYHLLVQRLLRLTAREALKKSDGRALGKMVRLIIGEGILSGVKVGLVSKKTAKSMLENAGFVLKSPEEATDEAIKKLLDIS